MHSVLEFIFVCHSFSSLLTKISSFVRLNTLNFFFVIKSLISLFGPIIISFFAEPTSSAIIAAFSFIIFVFVLFVVGQLSYSITAASFDLLFYEFPLISHFKESSGELLHAFGLFIVLVIGKYPVEGDCIATLDKEHILGESAVDIDQQMSDQ